MRSIALLIGAKASFLLLIGEEETEEILKGAGEQELDEVQKEPTKIEVKENPEISLNAMEGQYHQAL